MLKTWPLNENNKGIVCSSISCPNKCNGRGICDRSGVILKCICPSGYFGNDCSQPSCPNNSSNNGKCLNGTYLCNDDFGGSDCSFKLCPNNCNNKGTCLNGVCIAIRTLPE
jgi:hypothetical protein